jgi:DNA-binding transcriptional regulator YhcF (GntR family)
VPNEKVALPLFEQIVEETMRAISTSELFNEATVAELRKLADNRELSQADAVAEVLERRRE